MKRKFPLTHSWMAALSLVAAQVVPAAEKPSAAAQAVNALGLDLLAKGTAARQNALLSPYSIQTALAMTYAGAAGETRAQMAGVLHYPQDEAALHQSFGELRKALEGVAKNSEEHSKQVAMDGGAVDPIVLTVANRLFGQQGYEFRPTFLDLVKDGYGALLEAMDFVKDAEAERAKINGWVEDQTKKRISDLIPKGGVGRDTRLVLVNAIYLKAPWAKEFSKSATGLQPFHLKPDEAVKVPAMRRTGSMGYAKRDGYQVITVPYVGEEMQLLVLLPDTKDGLAALESKLTPEILASCATPDAAEVDLYLPKFKMEPPVMQLGESLRTLGMTRAFDEPKGSADFDRMAPRRPDDYLSISEVFHKTFLALDEKGTEAAAATAVVMIARASFVEKPKPVEVRVDRPFLFAIQHRESGACLFVGRLCDPR